MRGWVERWWWAVFGTAILGGGLVADRAQEAAPASTGALTAVVLCAVEVDELSTAAVLGDVQRTDVQGPAPDPRCDEAGSAPGASGLQVHDEPPDAVGAVVVSGRLQVGSEPLCAYLVTGDGPLALVWPAGTGLDPDPARITGEGGRTLASAGDLVRLRGRYVDGAAQACGPAEEGGMAFLVGSVGRR